MNSNRPQSGIATDAAHSTKNGITEFRGVDIRTGDLLFYEQLGNMTVNIGEYLGLVAAVKYIIENRFMPQTIYTDSMTAITWYHMRKTASKKRNTQMLKSEIFLLAIHKELSGISVHHWNNSLWGEIPADFGHK